MGYYNGSYSVNSTVTTLNYYDGSYCPNHNREREAVMYLYCAYQQEIIGVREPETCFYEIKVKTPLACALSPLEIEEKLERYKMLKEKQVERDNNLEIEKQSSDVKEDL